jgi:hypothetical protein
MQESQLAGKLMLFAEKQQRETGIAVSLARAAGQGFSLNCGSPGPDGGDQLQ